VNNPLNPRLYKRLETVTLERFGEIGDFFLQPVRVSSFGLPASTKVDIDAVTGEKRTEFVDWGEVYRIPCPACHAERANQREPTLSISHAWGAIDKVRKANPKYHHKPLVSGGLHCHNEDCEKDPDNKREFIKLFLAENATFRSGTFKEHDRTQIQIATATVREPQPPPAECIGIDELDLDHPARLYLERRGFDVKVLREHYGVKYGLHTALAAGIRGRIVIPLIHDNKEWCWQSRYPADIDFDLLGVKRYYNPHGSAIRRFLYNHDRARKYSTIVLVEGPTGVWALGDWAVAAMGKGVSDDQILLLSKWAAEGATLIIATDPPKEPGDEDHQERFVYNAKQKCMTRQCEKLVREFTEERLLVCPPLPFKTDVADLSIRSLIGGYLSEALPIRRAIGMMEDGSWELSRLSLSSTESSSMSKEPSEIALVTS
jgi:hypothetical protein